MTRTHTPAMCLLHADFHVMAADCWQTAVAWHAAHPDLGDDARRADYQAVVEAHALDQLRHDRTLPESEDPTSVNPTTCPTPECTLPKEPKEPLCRGCLYTLQPAARRALGRDDDYAAGRRAELDEQLQKGVPLRQVVITP